MNIKIFTVGGTIDKTYSDKKGTLNFFFGETQAIKELIETKLNLNLKYDIERIIAKDSLEMDDKDRQLIKKACEKTTENKILITHGSDTMIDTAKILSTIQGKTILLTGASQPY